MNNQKNTITATIGQNFMSAPGPSGRKDLAFSRDLSSLPDENLYNLCKEYGERTRIWRQRFTGLLPEVFKRKLYEKKGFSSIFEFSKKLAGLSEEQTRLVLNLEKRFEETPALKTLLTTGKVSINKLARIVSIAKPENEKFLANQVQILSKSAVETLVRDEKFATKNETENFGKTAGETAGEKMDFQKQNGLFEPGIDPKSLPGQTLNLSPEVQQKLLELQQKGIDINTLLLEFLKTREQEIAQKKEEIGQKILQKENSPAPENPYGKPSRHIPVSVKKILYLEHGTKCSVQNCQKPSTQIHHVRRFSAVPSHNPHYLAPLCKAHHELAHSADIDYIEMRRKAC
ncbi:MAG: HNH endonuclease signature motif containing protein [Candidatus Gracilibacteria bacterium]